MTLVEFRVAKLAILIFWSPSVQVLLQYLAARPDNCQPKPYISSHVVSLAWHLVLKIPCSNNHVSNPGLSPQQ